MTKRRIKAISYQRYNGGARVKREFGSSTVTKFFVNFEDTPGDFVEVEGYGKTPGERKTYAIREFARQSGVLEP